MMAMTAPIHIRIPTFFPMTIPNIGTNVYFWIPSVLNATDPSVIEGPFQPTALYVSEDDNYGVAVFLNDIGSASLEDYAKMMETEGGGSNFRNVMINGISCVGYEIEENDMECLIYPVTDNVIVTFTCNPLNGDEGWDATKGVIFAQRVMNALIGKGLSREEAYDTVQPIAMKAWSEGLDYSTLLQESAKVMGLLSKEELDSCFTLDYYFKNVDYIFDRVGIK